MGKSTATEEDILEHFLGIQANVYQDGQRWLALYSAGGNLESNLHTDELTAQPGYSRLSVTFQNTGAGEYKNVADTSILTAGVGGWLSGAPVTHFAVTDNATAGAGNILYYEALTTAKVVNEGDPVGFLANAVVIKEN